MLSKGVIGHGAGLVPRAPTILLMAEISEPAEYNGIFCLNVPTDDISSCFLYSRKSSY